jgi:4-amino-4-deoxy-L-arabinose transferase-like glycosyltransferase
MATMAARVEENRIRVSAAPATGAHECDTRVPALVLFVLGSFFCFYRLGSYGVVNGDEAVYHRIATTMVESGNWLRLEFGGRQRIYDTLMNAPLQYWARALLITLFGDSYWTMRFLSAALGVGTVMMTFRLGLLLGDVRSAFLAGLVQLTTFQFVYLHSARTGELETAVAFVFTLIAWSFLRAAEGGRSFVAHHLCLILLANLKLPLLMLPVIAELAWFALQRPGLPLFRRWGLSGIAIVPLALAWHAIQLAWLWEPLQEVTNRMVGEASGQYREHELGLLRNARYYAGVLLFGAFPYSLAYPFAVAGTLIRSLHPVDRARWQLVGLFPLVVLAFFCAVAKHFAWYVAPAYPFLSLFLGAWLAALWRGPPGVLALIGVASIVSLLIATTVDMDLNPFAERARRIAMEFSLRELPWSPWIGIPVVAGLIAAALAWLRSRWERLPGVVAVGLAAVLVGIGGVRIAIPFGFLPYPSELEQARRELDAARAAGQPVRYPLELRDVGMSRARYYFADEYAVAKESRHEEGGDVIYYLIYEKGDPRARRDDP